MKKEINQNEGNNQIAFIHSNDNQVTVINNPIEEIKLLIRKGKLKEAVDIVAQVNEEAKKMHPLYPKYIYNPVQFGSNIAFEHRPMNRNAARELPLEYRAKFLIKDKDVLEGETLNELLMRKYFSQESINIDIEHIETWIGKHKIDDSFAIEQIAAKEAEWSIIPSQLPPPMKVKIVMTNNGDEEIVIDYIELKITNIIKEEGVIIISNIYQEKSPIVLSLKLPSTLPEEIIATESSKIDFRIRESFENKVIGEETFLNLVKHMSRNSNIALVEVESQREIFNAKTIELDYQQDLKYVEERIHFLSELRNIETLTDVEFQIPDRIDDDELDIIDILKGLINRKEIKSKVVNFSTITQNKSVVKKITSDIKCNPMVLTIREYKNIHLFGVDFDTIECIYTIDNLVIKDLKKLHKKLNYMEEGETIKIEFKPGTKNIMTAQYKFKNEML